MTGQGRSTAKKQKILLHLYSDYYIFCFSTKKQIVNYSLIEQFQYYRVTIPITKLKGKNLEITVRLKPAATNYIDPKVEVEDLPTLITFSLARLSANRTNRY